MKTYNQFITELSAGTLARYIRKATGSLRGAAAKHGRNVTLGKPIEYRKYLNKNKTASSPLGSTERMMNRETGIKRAADKLAGKSDALEFELRSTQLGNNQPKKPPFPDRDFKKDPYGINWLDGVLQDAKNNPWKTGDFKPFKKK